MKRTFYILLLAFCFEFVFGQKDTVIKIDTKYYRVFSSLSDARKVNPDSVFGLDLCCEGLKEFPKEVFNYKNLEFLSFYTPDWNDPIVYKHLSDHQKKKYKKIKSKQGMYDSGPKTPEYYPKNKIKIIPSDITNLKKLKFLGLPNTKWDDAFLTEILRLEKLMLTTTIDPPSKAVELQLKLDQKDEAIHKSKD